MEERVNNIRNKFDFVDNVKFTFGYVISYLNTDSVKPQISIDMSKSEGKYNYGGKALALDLGWYERYKPLGDTIIIGFCYIVFFYNVYRNLPSIINGSSSTITKGIAQGKGDNKNDN